MKTTVPRLVGLLALWSLGALGSAAEQPAAPGPELIVVGATPGGVMAAVAAARLGHTVVLAEYEDHVGGIVSNGLTNADISNKQAVAGIYSEFRRRVVQYYEQFDRGNPKRPNVKACRDGYLVEAHVAERVFNDMLRRESPRIRLCLRHELKRAIVENNRLVAVVLEDRDRPGQLLRLAAKVFVDATYEGDLAAMAGAPYRTGREARGEFGEPHAGRIYMRFGTPQPLPGSTGEADGATEAYCFRFHVTRLAANRVPIEKPKNYNREDYRFVLDDIRSGKVARPRDIIQFYAMPNEKFELNSNHPNPATGVPSESLDLAEDNWSWPEASPAKRRQIYQRYVTHNVGLVWLLQNDPEVPSAVREEARQYGWCRDEWPANGHVPRQVYVRQGRRIVGDYMLTEHDGDLDPALDRTRIQPTSIGIVEWSFDSHACHKYDPLHPGVREGYTMVGHPPFQVPYGVLVPRRIDGLLVPVACSCSHVAYNALRMEPVFMALGQASGIAAHLAIATGAAVRRVPTARLQQLLVERGGVITCYSDLKFDDPSFAAFQWLGARGLNPGYQATATSKLTRRDGWTKLARILRFQGITWPEPQDNPDRPLQAAALAQWLRQVGCQPSEAEFKALGERQLDLAEFAQLTYRTLRPAASDATRSSSGKPFAGAMSTADTAMRRAAALGYTLHTFHTGPWNAAKTIDWQNTGAVGFQWYLNKPFGGKPTPPNRLTVHRDGSLTLDGGEINAFSAPTSHGIGFGGGAYFEATFSFDPQSVIGHPHDTWPAWWAMSLEHFLNLPGQHWTGQPNDVMHFAEMDFFEYDTWKWAGQNTYGGATHDWGGTWGTFEGKKRWQYNYHNDKFVNRLPQDVDFTKPHRYGYLWVPATATSQGYAHYYFDGQPTTDKVTWSWYDSANPPPPPAATAPWKFGVNDCQHMALILGTGTNQPMTVYSVDVWQASSTANIHR